MTTSVETQKLAVLCAKTDQQLLALVSSRLDRGLSFARLLLDDEARESWSSLDDFAIKAEEAYTDVSRLLPLVRSVAAPERRRLQSRLMQLREILDCAALCSVPRVQAAAML